MPHNLAAIKISRSSVISMDCG